MGEHVVNGQERVVTAAFNDSQMYLLRYGIMKKELNFRDMTSYEERRKSFIQHMRKKSWKKEIEWSEMD